MPDTDESKQHVKAAADCVVVWRRAGLWVFLLGVCGLVAGCSFADYARNSRGYPGAYDRALGNAARFDLSARADLERLGAAKEFNGKTHDLLWCIDRYVYGLEAKQALSQAGAVLNNRAGAYLDGMSTCVTYCGRLVENQRLGNDDPLFPRDEGLARKYLAHCQAEASAATLVVASQVSSETLADVEKGLTLLERDLPTETLLAFARRLMALKRQLVAITVPSPTSQVLHARLSALESARAAELGRVRRYDQDPRVLKLSEYLQHLKDEHNKLAGMRQAASFSSTDLASQESATDRLEQLSKNIRVIEQQLRECEERLAAIQREYAL